MKGNISLTLDGGYSHGSERKHSKKAQRGVKAKEEKLRKEIEVRIVGGYSRQSRKVAFKGAAHESQRGDGSSLRDLFDGGC